jgi:hypothetical protein
VADIMIKCPATGKEVPVGIDTDEVSFRGIPNDTGIAKCPACGNEHEWKVSDAWLKKRETTQRPGRSKGASD